MDQQKLLSDGRRRRSARSRKAILISAKEVFLEKGYQKTTFKDISSRAGIGYGTIYLHFSDKEELMQTLVDGIMEEAYKVVYIEYHPSKFNDVREIAFTQIKAVLNLAIENRNLFRIIWDALSHSQSTRSYWEEIFERFIQRIIEDLRYSQKHGLARPLNERVIAKSLVYMVREFLWDLVWERETDVDEVSYHLIELYIGGAYFPVQQS